MPRKGVFCFYYYFFIFKRNEEELLGSDRIFAFLSELCISHQPIREQSLSLTENIHMKTSLQLICVCLIINHASTRVKTCSFFCTLLKWCPCFLSTTFCLHFVLCSDLQFTHLYVFHHIEQSCWGCFGPDGLCPTCGFSTCSLHYGSLSGGCWPYGEGEQGGLLQGNMNGGSGRGGVGRG